MPQKRSIRRIGAHLALFALWVRLVIGFGHIHPEDIFGPAGGGAEPGIGVTQFVADQHGDPLGHESGSGTSDECAICAVMALADVLVLADPIALAMPTATGISVDRIATPIHVIPAAFLLFRTRAPPIGEIA
jgi:hypothetical protein